MKPKLVLLILSLSISSSSLQTRAATLPDACGNDKVKFDITLQKNPPAHSTPDPGKGQIIFIEASKKPPAMGNCNNFTRYGVDGAWVGAPPKTTLTSQSRWIQATITCALFWARMLMQKL